MWGGVTMISKIVGIGNRVEFTKVESSRGGKESVKNILKKKVYSCQVCELIDDTRIKVTMPIEGGHVVAVSLNTKLDACFYTTKGLYHGRVIVVDRMKEDKLHVMVVELQYELEKFQRRQYYRLSCTMDLQFRKMEEEEITAFIKNKDIPHERDLLLLKDGVALDFSGGGIRFVSKEHYEKGDLLFVKLKISYEETYKCYVLVGRVVTSSEGKNGREKFETRIEFVDVSSKIREEIIKYIFFEERKQRKADFNAR